MHSISQVIHDCETCAAIKQAKRVKPLWYGGQRSKYKYREAWQIDYITLPQTRQGQRYVLTMVEATTGWLETYPVPHATARNTMVGLEKQILWRHGTPERIESDNGTHFKNSLINTWAREHAIECTPLMHLEATQPDESFQPYSKIKQLPSEPLGTFVERLTRAIELQVKNERAQEQVLEEMALANADKQCKAPILSLSIEVDPTLRDMLQQKSPDMIVKDPATRETKRPHDQVTWGRGYAYVSTAPDPKWVPAEWVQPFIPKTAKPPAEGPQVASAAKRRRKHPTFSF
ncbi:hypothetical protein DUI87_20040 [Hirundo rustica rustica]|uniref:Integrase catalytic domain-containing protein n=1 Tax=Hirundo rustica rustica TaxID=333673 RepID=A0A3M0JP97_HIRRU|nr:hypothetical protein DUI87_20040 [Hirundo rustica rustica]